MASILRRVFGAADESKVVQEAAGQAAEGVARTPERALTQPFVQVREGATGTAKIAGASAVGVTGVGGGAYAYGQRQNRLENADTIEERNEQREQLDEILDDEDISEEAKESALERALGSGLFDPNLGGSEEPDNVFENIWFRRILALLAAYYVLKTLNSRLG